MADIKISELSQAESLSLSDLMESAIPYNGGFQSRRMSLAQLSNYLENSVLHNALDTTAKNIIGAINEIFHDLDNYYTKSETYSKTKIDELIAGVSGLHFLVVQTLPVSDIDPNTIYLVPKQDVGTQDIYDEFIYIVEEAPTPSHWEKIGTTEIDLSDYVTDTELATELLNYVTTSVLNTTLQSYATTSAMTTALADKVDKVSGKGLSTEDYTTAEKTKLNGLATVATSGSYNDLTNKPTIPDELADLADDSTHRLVTDTEKDTWNNKRLLYGVLNTEDLNDLRASAVYVGGSDNTCLNKPTDVRQFSLLVLKTATSTSNYCEQILITPRGYEWRRNDYNGTWSAWVMSEFTDTTYESKAAASGGTDVSLVTTGEKYNWNNKAETSDITSAINDLDVASTSIGQGETLATIKEENGKIAVTKQDIKIGLEQVDNFYRCGTQNAISGSNTWHKIASTTMTAINTDANLMLAVYDSYLPDTDSSETNCGILYCRVRQGALGVMNDAKLEFVANSGFDTSKFRLYYTITTDTSITFEIWTSMNRRYGWRKYSLIGQSDRLSIYSNSWTIYNSTSPSAPPTESATCVKVDCTPFNYVTWDEENVYGAKNLIPFPYLNGQSQRYYYNKNITVYTDDDGVLTITGSNPDESFGFGISGKTYKTIMYLDPTKAYVMSGMSGGSASTVRFLLDLWTENQNPETDTRTTRLYQSDGETIIPSGYRYLQITLYFYTSAASLFPLTVKPMLRFLTATDSTFVPYAKTNKQLTDEKLAWNDYSEYGIKNLIPYPWVHENGRSTRGIVFGVEDEGYISLNGTANASNQPFFSLTSATAENVALGKSIKIRNGKKYTLSLDRTDDRIWAIAYIRDLTGTAVSPASIAVFEDGTVRKINADVSNYVSLNYSGVLHSSVTFEISTVGEYYLQIDLRVSANSGTYSSATAKGRVSFRDANITDDTWTKYSASNLELTKRKADYSQIATYESTNNASKAYSVGDYMIWKGVLQVVRADIASGDAITSGTNVEATDIGIELKKSIEWKPATGGTIPESGSSSKVYIASKYAKELYISQIFLINTTLGVNVAGYCSLTVPLPEDSSNNYYVYFFRGDTDNKLYDGRLLIKKDSTGVYGYVSQVFQDGVNLGPYGFTATLRVYEKS